MNSWLSKLESSGWLDEVQAVLGAACFVAQVMDKQGIFMNSNVIKSVNFFMKLRMSFYHLAASIILQRNWIRRFLSSNLTIKLSDNMFIF